MTFPPARGRRRFLFVGACAMALLGLALAAREGFPKTAEPTPEVLQAIRLLLSEDSREEARGEHALRRMGPSIAPQLRYFVRKVRNEADRVEIVLSDLEGKGPADRGGAAASTNSFFHGKLLECRELSRKGEVRKALAIAEAVGVLDTDGPYTWEIRRLARRAKERLVAREVLEPEIESRKLVCEAGDRPEVFFRITNHESRLARIRLEKGVLGTANMSITRLSLDGSSNREERMLRIKVPDNVEAILIEPGQTWEHPIEVDTVDAVPRVGIVARIQIEGRFRPTRWTVEAKDENLSIRMPRTELWVVPPGEGELAEKPLEMLTAALFFGKLEPFFTGGQLAVWAGEEDPYLNEKVVETLIGNLAELDAGRKAIAGRLLNQATGQTLAPEPARWREWWGKMTGGEPEAGKKRPDAPRGRR